MYNLFISHSWDYSGQYDRLVGLLKNAPGFEYRDYSVPREKKIDASNDRELRAAITNQMAHASCVIIIAGVYATYRKWIETEIKIAKEMGKKIIAVIERGAERSSSIAQDAADKIVRWNTDSIVDAIKEVCNED